MFGIAMHNRERCDRINQEHNKKISPLILGVRTLDEAQKLETIFQVYQNKIALLGTYNILSRSCIYVGQYFIKNPKVLTSVSDDQKTMLKNFANQIPIPVETKTEPLQSFRRLLQLLDPIQATKENQDLKEHDFSHLPITPVKNTFTARRSAIALIEGNSETFCRQSCSSSNSYLKENQYDFQKDNRENFSHLPRTPVNNTHTNRRSAILMSLVPTQGDGEKENKQEGNKKLQNSPQMRNVLRNLGKLIIKQARSRELRAAQSSEEKKKISNEYRKKIKEVDEQVKKSKKKREENFELNQERKGFLKEEKRTLICEVSNALVLPEKIDNPSQWRQEALRLTKPFQINNSELFQTEARRQLHTERMVGGVILFGGVSVVAFTTAVIARKHFQ